MVLEYVKRLLGAREKPDPRELLGLLQGGGVVEQDQGGSVPFDLYTLLEDEKISRELWPYVLGFATRDTKLTYFTEKDERYLFWKIEALATRIGMALNAQTPPPERFPSLEDYVKLTNANQLLVENLKIWMLAVARRSTLGFERRLQAMRHYVVSYGQGMR